MLYFIDKLKTNCKRKRSIAVIHTDYSINHQKQDI